MPGRTINIPRYIKLISPKELKREDVKDWFATVRDNAPNGILMAVETISKGKPRSVRLVYRQIADRQELILPISRDLSDKEVEAIVQAWMANHPDLETNIEISSNQVARLNQDGNSVIIPNDDYMNLCLRLAKTQHQNWVKDRSDAGWRYGTTISFKNKTHPLLRPWDDLPAQYRKVDDQTPERVLDLLNNQGYAVVRREELDSLLRLMRSVF